MIQQQFERFHRDHPEILVSLETLTEQWLSKYQRASIGMLWEVLRYQTGLGAEETDYRLNNNYRSRYVRLMIDRHPEWNGRFEIRKLRSP